jgi:hypothetical protein
MRTLGSKHSPSTAVTDGIIIYIPTRLSPEKASVPYLALYCHPAGKKKIWLDHAEDGSEPSPGLKAQTMTENSGL